MNVTSKSWAINKTEQAYRQFEPKIRNNNSQNQHDPVSNQNNQVASGKEKISARQVLSKTEIDTIRLLFEQPSPNASLYGKNRVHSVQAGLFLDIKG